MGAWIETCNSYLRCRLAHVAPLVGAWIETEQRKELHDQRVVAPLVGAWIETFSNNLTLPIGKCRSPRGSVD